MKPQEEINTDLVRDTSTGALINKNKEALDAARAAKKLRLSTNQRLTRLEDMMEKILKAVTEK